VWWTPDFSCACTTLDEVQGKRMKDGTCFVCIV